MAPFIIVHRLIGNDPFPLAINLAQIKAIHPAVYFGHNGPDFRDGSHIRTDETSAEMESAWHVVETFEEIMAMMPRDFVFGGRP
jgi:hypothetical protein